MLSTCQINMKRLPFYIFPTSWYMISRFSYRIFFWNFPIGDRRRGTCSPDFPIGFSFRNENPYAKIVFSSPLMRIPMPNSFLDPPDCLPVASRFSPDAGLTTQDVGLITPNAGLIIPYFFLHQIY